MKPNDDQWQSLLNDVLPTNAATAGPNDIELLAMVRTEQARRLRQRAMLSTAAIMLLGLLTFIATSGPRETPARVEVAAAAPSVPALPSVQKVNDEELLALLKGTPAALMEWPDGKKTLLIVER